MTAQANWFFGFPVDRIELCLPMPPPHFRLFAAEDLHITLAFLGACGEARALRALAVLDEALLHQSWRPTDISLGRVQPFGDARRYSALSAVLDRGQAQLSAQITALRGPLTRAAEQPVDDRPAKPHLTLARPSRSATDAERRQGLMWADGLRIEGRQARLDRIALYTWTVDRSVRLFRVVAERRAAAVTPPHPA